MPQFVSDREGGTESVVLDDGTTLLRVTHRPQLGQSQRVTLSRSSADISSCQKNGHVVVGGTRVVPVVV